MVGYKDCRNNVIPLYLAVMELRRGYIDLPFTPADDVTSSPEESSPSNRLTHIDVTDYMRELCVTHNASLRSKTTSPEPMANQPEISIRTEGSKFGSLPELYNATLPLPIGPNRGNESRPKLPRKAKTAPPGRLYVIGNIPELPRRAISARIGGLRSHPTTPSPPRRETVSAFPRWSVYKASAEARSIISRRKKAAGKLGLRTRAPRGSMSPSSQLWQKSNGHKYEAVSLALKEEGHGKGNWDGLAIARGKRVARKKRVGYVDTDFFVDFNARALPDTPGSMVSTPRELYAHSPAHGSQPRASPVRVEAQGRPQFAHAPTAARANSPAPSLHESDGETSDRARSPTPIPQHRDIVLRTGSILSIIPPEKSAWKQTIYIPGPIQLAQHPTATAVSRKGSVATIEPFLGGLQSERRRSSDDAALEGIVAHFEALKVVPPASTIGLDRYWEEQPTRWVRSGRGGPAESKLEARETRPPIQSVSSTGSDPLPHARPPVVVGEEKQQQRPSARRGASQPGRLGLRRLLESVNWTIP